MVLMEALDHQKNVVYFFNINFTKSNTKLCLILHFNADNTYFFVNGKEIFKVKTNNKIVNVPTQFCLGSISNGFSATESREVKRKCV